MQLQERARETLEGMPALPELSGGLKERLLNLGPNVKRQIGKYRSKFEGNTTSDEQRESSSTEHPAHESSTMGTINTACCVQGNCV